MIINETRDNITITETSMYKVMKTIILRRSYHECLLNEKRVKQNDISPAQSVVKIILKYL